MPIAKHTACTGMIGYKVVLFFQQPSSSLAHLAAILYILLSPKSITHVSR